MYYFCLVGHVSHSCLVCTPTVRSEWTILQSRLTMLLPALPNNLHFLFLSLATSLFFLLSQHTGRASEQEMKQGRMGTSCFSVPLWGGRGRGRGRERNRVLGHFRPLEAPLWGTKTREQEDEEESKGGDVESGKNRSAGCYSLRVTLPPPSAFPPVGLSKLNTHFPEK